MKKVLVVAAVMISQLAFSQPRVKLYGYSRDFLPGMAPQRDIPGEDGGQSIKRPSVITEYYIFTSSTAVIQPKEIWLAGNWYSVSNSVAQATPVLVNDAEKKQLVPATTQKVLRIERGDTINTAIKTTPALQKMTAANELIISYLWKGKKYYTAIKKLVVLEPLHAM